MNQIKTPGEIESMRIGGQMLAAVLRHVEGNLQPGLTTAELDAMAASEVKRLGGKPAFLGFQGFPKVMCISVNEEVQHAIPGRRVLAEGDIVNLDFGVDYEGMITDAGITVGVGKISADATRLLKACEEALAEGIAQVRAGARVGDISHAVGLRLTRDRLGIVDALAGHGVGHELHEEPTIENEGRAGTGMRLKAGMTIAIEPIATLGTSEILIMDDDWTLVTADHTWAAQFEHTVLVLPDGAEILTL